MGRRIQRRVLGQQPTSFGDSMHPVLARVYAGRDVRSAAELEYGLDRLVSYRELSQMDAAVDLLAGAIGSRSRILIVADFDADGATSCALAVRGLRLLGAEHVDYLVPNRFEYGYGLTPEIVDVAAERNPGLLVTVDNGVSSIAGVDAARKRGMRVLVTDHHLPGERLPAADAIVNPNQPGDGFPSKNLAGVGVMFYVLAALRARLREQGHFGESGTGPNLACLLDLVALGTVADVVPLDHNNRILVAQGLARIRAGRAQPGVTALLEVAGREPARAVASDLAFVAGPRLNAAGRLKDMTLGIECLLAGDEASALAMARDLDALNRERRTIEADMQEEALARLRELDAAGDDLPYGLCLFQPGWHEGVIGILASRIKERHNRPVVAFAPSDASGGAELKGSARSVPGVHVRDVLDAVAARHPGLITRFGGHAMAAGLSLPRENYEPFQAAFDTEVREHLTESDLEGTLLSDGTLRGPDLGLPLAHALRSAGPWGQGFPEPLFDGEFVVLDHRVVGGRHLKLSLGAADVTRPLEAIAFNTGERRLDGARRLRAAYRLDVNLFRGVETAQLVVEYLEPLRT